MKQSISTRLMLIIAPVALLIFGGLIFTSVWMATSAQKELAYQGGDDLAWNYANKLDAVMQADQGIGKTLASTMASNTTQSRQEVMDGLQNLLDQNPTVVGTYVGFEPNAFDASDASFVDQPGNDAAGRFVPYWNKLTGVKTLDPLLDIDTYEFYQIPKTTRAACVIEPYLYNGVLMTSLISPILRDGQFIGIAGADIALNDLDSEVKKIKTYQSGYAFLVSNTGIFISAPDSALIGAKTLADLAAEQKNPALQVLNEAIKARKNGYLETTDPFTGKQAVLF